MVDTKFNKKIPRNGIMIIASITVSYILTLYLFSKIMLWIFPDKPTEWHGVISFVVSPIIAVILGLVFLKILGRK